MTSKGEQALHRPPSDCRTTQLVREFPAGALLVPGATWPVGLPDVPRLDMPPVSEKSPGALPVVAPEGLIPGDAALGAAPTEVPPAVVPASAPVPAPPLAPPAPAANAQLEDIASAVAIAIVVIFITSVSLCLSKIIKDHGHLMFRIEPINSRSAVHSSAGRAATAPRSG